MADTPAQIFCDWRVTAEAHCVAASTFHILHGVALGLYAVAMVLCISYLVHRHWLLRVPFLDSFGWPRALEGLMASALCFYTLILVYHGILFTGQPVVSLLGMEVLYGFSWVVGFACIARYLIVLIKAVPPHMKNDTKRVFVPNNRATRALIAVFVFVSVVQPVLSGLSSQYPDYQAEFGEQTGTRYWLLLAYQAYWTVACSISGTVGNMFAVYLFRILGLNIRKLMNIQLAGQSSTSGTGSNSQIESEARAQASRRRTDATRIMITIGGVCAAFYANGGIALILCVWRVPIQSHAEGTVALAAIYWLVTPFMCVVHHIGCFYFARKASKSDRQSVAAQKSTENNLTTGSVTLDNAIDYLGKT